MTFANYRRIAVSTLKGHSRVGPKKDPAFAKEIYRMISEASLMDMPGSTYNKLDVILQVIEAYLKAI